MSKLFDLKDDFKGCYIEIPGPPVWFDLSVVGVQQLYNIYVDAYGEKPTTILFDAGDTATAQAIRFKYLEDLLEFWIPVPGMMTDAFILAGRKGLVMSPGA